MSQPEDPWAKWRLPAKAEASVNAPEAAEKTEKPPAHASEPLPEKKPRERRQSAVSRPQARGAVGSAVKDSAKDAAEAVSEAAAAETIPATAFIDTAPQDLTGRLGVRKTPASAAGGVTKRPLRGGALTRRPKPAPQARAEVAPRRSAEGGREGGRENRHPNEPRKDQQNERQNEHSKERAKAPPKARPVAAPRFERAADATGSAARAPRSAAKKTSVAEKSVPRIPAAASPRAAAEGVRVSKLMVERGLASRREADEWIECGWVWAAGKRISQLGARIARDAAIEIRREEAPSSVPAPREVTFLLHKPAGYSCERGSGEHSALSLLQEANRLPQPGDPALQDWMLRNLEAAGRLETENSGLLVLTRNSGTARRLLTDERELEREYLVRIHGELSRKNLELLREGLPLDGRPLGKTWVKQLDPGQLHFILREGQKRPLRRMCEAVGLTVKSIQRTRIGHLRLDKLPPGQWRFLRADESL